MNKFKQVLRIGNLVLVEIGFQIVCAETLSKMIDILSGYPTVIIQIGSRWMRRGSGQIGSNGKGASFAGMTGIAQYINGTPSIGTL